MRKLIPSRLLGLVAAMAFFLAPITLSPHLVGASEGPGSEFRECRADAHYDMAMCYHEERDNRFGYMWCNISWELDLLGCDAVVLEAICPFNWCEKAN